MSFFRACGLALVLGCFGCAPQAKPPAAPSQVVAASAETEAAPDLSPVSAPGELVAVGRMARPRAVVESFLSWAGFPLTLTQMLPSDLREVEGLVRWDAPLELAVTLDRESTDKLAPPLFVLTLGLTSLEAARAFVEKQGGQVTRMAPGVYRVEVQRATCAIAASLGSSPARLVCGKGWSDVQTLLPYATRGLPNETLGANDVFLEFRLRPVERRYHTEIGSLRVFAGLMLRQIETDDPRLDRALADLTYALSDELGQLAKEVDRLTLTANLDTTSRVLDLEYRLALQGTGSTFGQILRASVGKQLPAPAAFFRLPADVYSGGYGIAGDKERFAKLLVYVTEVADAYLAREKLGERFRARVRSAIGQLPEISVAAAYVSGGAAAKAGSGATERFLGNVGWHVGVLEQRADKVTGLLDELVAILNDREFAKWGVSKHKLDMALMPKAKSAAARVPTFAAVGQAYTLELPPKLAAQIVDVADKPADAGAAKDAKAAGNKAKAESITLTLVVVPDGAETWVAVAGTQRAAIERLQIAHSEGAKKLESIAELGPLKTVRSVSGGFTTVESLSRLFSEIAEEEGVDLTAALARVPAHGRTPILWWSTSTETGTEVAVAGKMKVPAVSIGDAGALILQTVRRK